MQRERNGARLFLLRVDDLSAGIGEKTEPDRCFHRMNPAFAANDRQTRSDERPYAQ